MSDNIMTTTSDIDAAIGVTYERTLLQPPQPEYIYAKYGSKKSIASKNGKQIKFRRYARLSAATTPLTEGITPSGSKLVKADLLATVTQYGDYVTVTDVLDLTVEDPEITIAVDKQNDQMNNTVDQLVRDYICASASSTTCSNGSGTATLLNRTDIQSVAMTLKGSEAKYMTGRIKAATGQGTSPIKAAFRGLADHDLEDDIEDVTGFKAVENYASASDVTEVEIGCTDHVRWETSTQGYVSGSTYSCPIIAKEAFALIDLNGGNASAIIKQLGSAGAGDPLNQRATVGWKMWQAVRILQDLNIHVLKCTNG